MNNRKWQIVVLAMIMLAMLSPLADLDDVLSTYAAPGTPDYSGYLSPSSATTETYRVTLYIQNVQSVAPPSSHWYDPGGAQVPPGTRRQQLWHRLRRRRQLGILVLYDYRYTPARGGK